MRNFNNFYETFFPSYVDASEAAFQVDQNYDN